MGDFRADDWEQLKLGDETYMHHAKRMGKGYGIFLQLYRRTKVFIMDDESFTCALAGRPAIILGGQNRGYAALWDFPYTDEWHTLIAWDGGPFSGRIDYILPKNV